MSLTLRPFSPQWVNGNVSIVHIATIEVARVNEISKQNKRKIASRRICRGRARDNEVENI
jgi:hypothetical protein